MHNFEKEFEEFCKSPCENSGKAKSYVKAIRYLCDYMEIYEMNEENINAIQLIEDNLNDKNSHFYQELLKFLSSRGKKSYLEGGFIKAALKYFHQYHKK